jgi:hypothetical protein
VTAVTNRVWNGTDQILRERFAVMLLSSILQILNCIQQKVPFQAGEITAAEPFENALASAMEKEAGLEEVKSAAVEPSKPSVPPPAPSVPMQSFEELIRAVTKFEKPERRVVDMFE